MLNVYFYQTEISLEKQETNSPILRDSNLEKKVYFSKIKFLLVNQISGTAWEHIHYTNWKLKGRSRARNVICEITVKLPCVNF